MSIIQNLRERYLGVTIVVVIIALLGFLLMDSIQNNFSSIFGGGPKDLASVNGEVITQDEFNTGYTNAQENYSAQNPGAELDDETTEQIRSSVIGELIRNKLLNEEFEKLDLQVSDAELKYFMTSENASQQLQQIPAFRNQQTGKFDGNLVKEYDRMVKTRSNPELTEENIQRWGELKSSLVNERRVNKYNALLVNSLYVPTFELEEVMKNAQTFASTEAVLIPYANIKGDFKVTDDELQKYIDAHRGLFKVEEDSRSAEYVLFSEAPSAADSAATLAKLNSELEKFKVASDPIAYLNKNSSLPYTSTYVRSSEVKNPLVSGASVGQIVGPYYTENLVSYTKIMGIKQVPDSVKAQHILMNGANAKSAEEVQQQADSIMASIRSGAITFEQAAAQYSSDESNKNKGGELGYFGRGMMVSRFEDSAFAHQTGDMYTVGTQFGIHIVKINDQKAFNPSYNLGELALYLEPSDATKTKVNKQINTFVSAAKNAKQYNEAVKSQKLTKRLIENAVKSSNMFTGVGLSPALNQWLFSHKKGDVSEPITIKNAKIVVKITDEIKKGYLKPSNIRNQWSEVIVNQKKAEMVQSLLKGGDLSTIAAKYGVEVLSSDSVMFAGSYSPLLGNEPKAMGYLFNKNYKAGAISPAIAGMAGVIVLKKRTILPTGELDKNQYPMIRSAVSSRFANRALQDAITTLYIQGDIEDNHNIFYQ